MAEETIDAFRQKQQRVIDIYTKRPEAALSTTKARGVVADGLRCEYTEGESSVVTDMPPVIGGESAGPSPGFYARAGLCSCLATGIKLVAVRSGIEMRRVTVDVEVDFDDGAMFGVGERSAAPLETRLTITIETDATEAEVAEVVEAAIATDPWFLALRDPQTVTTELTVAP